MLCYTNASIFSYLETEMDFDDKIPNGDSHGACEKQASKEIHKRVCRYGKCEVINDGTDFLCHCDQVYELKKTRSINYNFINFKAYNWSTM